MSHRVDVDEVLFPTQRKVYRGDTKNTLVRGEVCYFLASHKTQKQQNISSLRKYKTGKFVGVHQIHACQPSRYEDKVGTKKTTTHQPCIAEYELWAIFPKH